MREVKKDKKEIKQLLDSTIKMLEEEENNYNKCTKEDLEECYMQNIIKIKKAIKEFRKALREKESEEECPANSKTDV